MRQENMTTVWAATPKNKIEAGVPVKCYTGLRSVSVNIQTDISQLDLQEYGETVNEIVKLRTVHVPDIRKGDMLYLVKPNVVGSVEIDGVTYDDYGVGDYRVESVKPSRQNRNLIRNPTTISARIMTK